MGFNAAKLQDLMVQQASMNPGYLQLKEKVKNGLVSRDEAALEINKLLKDNNFASTMSTALKEAAMAPAYAIEGLTKGVDTRLPEGHQMLGDVGLGFRDKKQKQDLQNVINPQLRHDMTSRIIGSGAALLPYLLGN